MNYALLLNFNGSMFTEYEMFAKKFAILHAVVWASTSSRNYSCRQKFHQFILMYTVYSYVWSLFHISICSDGLFYSEWRLSSWLDEEKDSYDYRQKNTDTCP